MLAPTLAVWRLIHIICYLNQHFNRNICSYLSTKMKLLTIISALTSCCILANTASISRTSHSPEEDNIQLSSLTDAQREKLRTHFLQLIGVSIPDHSSTAASNISSQLNGRRAPLPLFDSSSTTSAHQNHKRSKREAHELPAHAHYLAALPAHQFGDLRLPSGRSLGPVSAVRIHASRGKLNILESVRTGAL